MSDTRGGEAGLLGGEYYTANTSHPKTVRFQGIRDINAFPIVV